MDFKIADVEAMPDKHIDVCLFNGAIRNSESAHVAKLLRQKSKVLVAFGSCASEGCIPALANFYSKEALLERVYDETPSTDNPTKIRPQTTYKMPEGDLYLPELWDTVYRLQDIVPIEYTVPGCPPIADQIWNVIMAIVKQQLPPPGAIVGAGNKVVCDECTHEKRMIKIKKFHRPHEIQADPDYCLLEQGIVCLGPVTRSGCGAMCLAANMPCRGCYGPGDEVLDIGAKMVSAIGSIIDSQNEEEIAEIVSEIVDPAGTFYRFGMAGSLLRRARVK